MERQVHGFSFEKKFSLFEDLTLNDNYTGKNDAFKDNIPYQIKYIKNNSSIDLGDYFRNSKKEKDFYLIIGFWEKEKDNVVAIYKLFIDKDKWNNLFNFSLKEELKEWISSVSNDYSYDKQWKEEMNYFKKEWNKTKREVELRFKRDHKTQKRIQCAINKSNFFNYFLKEFYFWRVDMV